MEYGDSSPFSSAPRSAPTVQGPPRLAPAPFVVPPLGGLSFPAEAGTPTGSSYLEQATGWPRRSTLRVDPRFGTFTTRRVVRRSASVDFAVRIVLRVLSLPWCPCRPCAGRGEVWQLDAVVAKHRSTGINPDGGVRESHTMRTSRCARHRNRTVVAKHRSTGINPDGGVREGEPVRFHAALPHSFSRRATQPAS